VKKKNVVTPEDKNDWVSFTKEMGDVKSKEDNFVKESLKINKAKKIDLHGFSLTEANTKVKKFIIESYNSGCAKLIVVTGKGLRSQSYKNPYMSKDLSILKNSIPEFIQNEESIKKKILRITQADENDGGEGALYIFLKKN
jgi:DNA-nicking Smr family endonuclease